MKFTINLILFSLFSTATQAQPKPVKPVSQNDPEAEKYLKALKDKYAQSGSYKLSYKMQATDANNKSTTMTGNYIGSGEKYIIELDHSKSVNDGKNIWSINTKEKEIQINKVSGSKKTKVETPIDIIKQYNKLFKYRVKEPIENGVIILELIPLDKNSAYFKIDIHIDVKKNQLTAAKLYDKGGNRVHFSISKTEEFKLSPTIFIIKTEDYKGFEVLDMR
jgi:outer membrane lipoprotein-sorting protein